MVFVRCLAADYLGVNGLFTNILTMLSLAELGIGNAIVYALYKPLAEENQKKIASLMQIYEKAYRRIGCVVGVIGLGIAPFLKVIITEQPNIIESIYLLYFINLFNIVITYFYSYRSTLIIAAQQNYIVAGVNYIITIAQSIFQIVILLKTHNYIMYLLIQTTGTIIYNIIVSNIAVVKFPYIREKKAEPLLEEEKKNLFGNIKDLMYYKVSSLLVNSTDNILITFFKGLAMTGVASNYTLIVGNINNLLGQVFNGLTASVGNYNAIEKEESKYELFCFLNLMNFWIYGWAALGIVSCSSDVVKLCFGQEYVLDIKIPAVMALNFFCVGMMNAVWTYKHTMGLFHYGRFLQIITGILNIIFSIILGNMMGLFGILFATFLARALTNLWYDPYAVFKYGFKKNASLYLKKYMYFCIVLMITGGVVWISFLFMKQMEELMLKVLLEILICSLEVNIIFFIAFHRSAEFEKLKEIAVQIMKRSRKKK